MLAPLPSCTYELSAYSYYSALCYSCLIYPVACACALAECTRIACYTRDACDAVVVVCASSDALDDAWHEDVGLCRHTGKGV